jgi:hypothetical protein
MIVPYPPVDAGPNAWPTAHSGPAPPVGPGRAYFFNAPPGSFTLTATPPNVDKPVDQLTVSVEAGTLTVVGVFPALAPPTP